MALRYALSKTSPIAKKEFRCCWYGCGKAILPGEKYVRYVWEDDEGEVYTDHICVSCWSKEPG